MSGDVIWMTILMWIAATAAFAPLGYFIYKYALKSDAGPFDDAEAHEDITSSKVLEIVGQSIHALRKGLIGGK